MSAELKINDRVRFNRGAGYPDGTITKIDTGSTRPFGVRWDDGIESWSFRDELLKLTTVDVNEMVMQTAALAEVQKEMSRAAERGYDQRHDDAHGPGHLLELAVDRLTHMGEYPTDAFRRHEMIVAAGLLVNAVRTLDRALYSGHTISVGSVTASGSAATMADLVNEIPNEGDSTWVGGSAATNEGEL